MDTTSERGQVIVEILIICFCLTAFIVGTANLRRTMIVKQNQYRFGKSRQANR